MSQDNANNIIRNMQSAPQERAYLESSDEEKADFEARIMIAYENLNTLEYTKAVNKATELMSQGLTYGKMVKRGEKAAQELCGPDLEADVVAGAMKKMAELAKLEKAKTNG